MVPSETNRPKSTKISITCVTQLYDIPTQVQNRFGVVPTFCAQILEILLSVRLISL